MNEPPSQVVVVGSHAPGLFVRVRRVPVAGETVIGWDFEEPMDGGKGSNQAIAASRLGVKTSFVGCLGKDRLGQEGERWMKDAGVDLRFTRYSEKRSTGVGFIILNEHGVPAMVTVMGANEELDPAQVDAALDASRGAKVMLTQFEIRPEVALHAAAAARRYGMTAILNPAPAASINPSDLSVANVLVPNETEARLLLGLDPEADLDPLVAVQQLRNQTQVDCALVTLGERGIVGADSSETWAKEAPCVEAVDTSGAGDVFCAAFAVGLVQGWPFRKASDWACLAASASVTRAGTIPAFLTADELAAFLDQEGWG